MASILLVGGSGMLGSEVKKVLEGRGIDFVAPSSKELDLTELESIAQIVGKNWGTPDWCLNCAAYTAVDKAETERQAAYDLNALAPSYLTTALQSVGCKIVHLSTDYVFDGSSEIPYTTDAPTKPLGVYGESKLQGEISVLRGSGLVVRTSWLFGPVGSSFPKSIIRAAEAGKPLKVVADQVGRPTYAPFLAEKLVDLIEQNPYPGVYHACGSDVMSWFEFAQKVLLTWGASVEVSPILSEDWPTPAKRPKNSVLDILEFTELVGEMPAMPAALADFCVRLRESGAIL